MSPSAVTMNQARTAPSRPSSRELTSNSSASSSALRNPGGSTPEPAGLACQRRGCLAKREEGTHSLVGALENGRPVPKVGALVVERLQSLRRSHGALVRMIDVPGWGADSALVVQDGSQKKRGLRFGEKGDAAWRMAWPVHHGQ